MTSTDNTPALPPIAITAGEPAGIGPDLCVQIAQRPLRASLVVVADPELLRERAVQLGLPLHVTELSDSDPVPSHSPGRLCVAPVPRATATTPGLLSPANGEYVLTTLTLAVEGCTAGRYAALVTAPVHKGVINQAGVPFTGHTEFLAALTGGHPVMMLTCPGLRVALATTHLPLRDVADAIDRPLLEHVLGILEQDLRQRFGIARPRILVCGLNPHAGEGGYLGREEIDVIEPALQALRARGMLVEGPLPADTLFTPKYLDRADAVLAMYHDQGLPVLKHRGFGQAVNITLGLPIIRTSVDHGTALELAGTGRADPGSLLAAIEEAIGMAEREVGR